MNKPQRETKPLVVLHWIPTANELEEIRQFMIDYKQTYPNAGKREIRITAQNIFTYKKLRKNIRRQDYARKKIDNPKTKTGLTALTRR